MNEEAIFAAAIEKNSPEERAAFLDQACGDDAELRHRVEGLLKAYDQPDAFLENPLCHAAETVDRASLDEQPGAMIGRYKLLQELGEGGMGTVFMAEQTHPVKRRVAVKIISVLSARLREVAAGVGVDCRSTQQREVDRCDGTGRREWERAWRK